MSAKDRETLIEILRTNPWSQTDFSLNHVAGKVLEAGFRREEPITDTEVEAACRVLYPIPDNVTFQWWSACNTVPANVRDALEAARKVS